MNNNLPQNIMEMSLEKPEDYMIQVKATCKVFTKCEIKNVVNCRRCLKAKDNTTELIGGLLQGLGFKEEDLDNFIGTSQLLSQSLLPQADSSKYWCFKCNKRHRLKSKIGKKHQTLKENQ